MKVKYKYIGIVFMDEDKLINYLEEMALKGWRLAKIGTTFFKFIKQDPQPLKYQIDYNELTDDYLEVMKMEGYKLVDRYNAISIFYSNDMNATDLYSDSETKLMNLKNIYKISAIFNLLLLAIIINWIGNLNGEYDLIIRNTVGSYLMDFNVVLIHYLCKFLALSYVIEAIQWGLIRWNINHQLEKKDCLNKVSKYTIFAHKIVSSILLIIFGIFVLSISIERPSILIVGCLSVLALFIYAHFVNKRIRRETNEVRRGIKLIIVVALYFVVDIWVLNTGIISKKEVKADSIFQEAKYEYKSNKNGLWVSSNLIYGQESVFGYDGYSFFEEYYTCLNDYVADEVFKELICQHERGARMELEKPDRIIDKNGHWAIPILSYDQAVKKFTKIESDVIDKGYYLDNFYYMVKDNHVLSVKVKDEVNIDELIKHYFK